MMELLREMVGELITKYGNMLLDEYAEGPTHADTVYAILQAVEKDRAALVADAKREFYIASGYHAKWQKAEAREEALKLEIIGYKAEYHDNAEWITQAKAREAALVEALQRARADFAGPVAKLCEMTNTHPFTLAIGDIDAALAVKEGK